MAQENDIIEVMQRRQQVLQEAAERKARFFEVAVNKMTPFIENLKKYKMQYLQMQFEHGQDFGDFSMGGKSLLMVTPKGVCVVDMTKDVKDAGRYVDMSLVSFNKITEEERRGHLLNITTYVAQNLDKLVSQEIEDIYRFYKNQLIEAQDNSDGWEQLTQNIA